MSQKNARDNRQQEMKMIQVDLQTQIDAAKEAAEKQQLGAYEHLKAQLGMVAEKYRTVNGFMQARDTMNQVIQVTHMDAPDDSANECRDLAKLIAIKAHELTAKLIAMDIADVDDTFLDGVIDENFIDNDADVISTTRELLLASLCQNVAPAVTDIVQFREATKAQIAELEAAKEAQK